MLSKWNVERSARCKLEVLRPILRQGLCVYNAKEVVRSNNRYVIPFDVLQALIVLVKNHPLFIQLCFRQQVC